MSAYNVEVWDSKSCVRSSRNQYVLPCDVSGALLAKSWYPRRMLPFLDHPRLQFLSAEKINIILAMQLVAFLDYTKLLEHKVVNRSLESIVYDGSGVVFSSNTKRAALQIYTDEGYHALFSDQVSDQVCRIYNFPDSRLGLNRISALEKLNDFCPQDMLGVLNFASGFVSETIIAKDLACITDRTIMPGVYEMFRDHLLDEARHSRFFVDVFSEFWEKAPLKVRDFFAYIIPEILKAFFSADIKFIEFLLSAVSVPISDICEVINDFCADDDWSARCRAGASTTIMALKREGFFDAQEYRGRFLLEGLID